MATKTSPVDLSTTMVEQPDELKIILEPIVAACVLAHQNALVVSEPGYGKTEIMYYMLRQVFGEEHSMILPCVPTTQASDVIGYANPIYSIDPKAEEKGIPYWITQGTPVDESVMGCLLDEAPRLGDLGNDTLVHSMHPISKFHRPVYLGTANWLQATPRNAALRDRFAYTVFYMPSIVDIPKLLRKKAISTWDFNLPTMEEVTAVRAWSQEYTQSDAEIEKFKCAAVIDDLLNSIQKLCEQDKNDFTMNNRHVFYFRSMLYAMGCWNSGANDFDEIPRAAYDALSYAYPVTDIGLSLRWRSLVMSCVDVIETELGEFQANAYEKWRQIRNQYARANGKLDADGLDKLQHALGKEWAEAEKELRARFPNDQRVERKLKEMFAIYRDMIRGNKV